MSAPITSKTRKRYRQELAAANPPVFVGPAGAQPQAASGVPLSASFKANDDGLMRFFRKNREARIDEGELDGEVPHLANIKANLKAVADSIAAEVTLDMFLRVLTVNYGSRTWSDEQGRESIQKASEIAQRLEDWGEQPDGAFQFLQVRLSVCLAGTIPCLPSDGNVSAASINPGASTPRNQVLHQGPRKTSNRRP